MIILLELVGPALFLGPGVGVCVCVLFQDGQVGAGLDCTKVNQNMFRMKSVVKLTNSFLQKTQIDVAFAAFLGVPLGLTGTRVPAASAFLCSRWIRSFFEMGMLTLCDVCVKLFGDVIHRAVLHMEDLADAVFPSLVLILS
jgi:hypothetical protein